MLLSKHDLFIGQIFDKALHKKCRKRVGCNTLSRGFYDQVCAHSTAYFTVLRKALLGNQGTGRRTQVFHPFSSSFFIPDRVLQKLHSQRTLAYHRLSSKIQPGRALVFSRNRLLKSREFKQYHHQAYQTQSFWDDSRDFRPKASYTLSHFACTPQPAWKAATGKNWPLRLLRFSTLCRKSKGAAVKIFWSKRPERNLY